MTATDVCLECWRDHTIDILHLNCTGQHVVPRAEADELVAWLDGQAQFIASTGQQPMPALEATEYAIRYGNELVLDNSWTCIADVIATYHSGFAEGGRVTGVLVRKHVGGDWEEVAW